METTWSLDIRRGWIIGLAFVALSLLAAITATVLAVLSPISLRVFLLGLAALGLLALAVRLAYQLWGLVSASYEMDRNALVIHWGGLHLQIPTAAVQRVLPGSELKQVRMRPGLRWPGYAVGIGQAEDIGTVVSYATQPLDQQVIVCTDGVAYAISPSDHDEFLEAFAERLKMGPTQEVEEETKHPAFFDWAIWRDRLGLALLISSVVLLVLLVGALCWRYPSLPAQVTLRYTPTGEPLLIAQASRVFYFALLGAGFSVINGVLGFLFYRRERTLAYFLWSGLVLVQLSLWATVISILTRT